MGQKTANKFLNTVTRLSKIVLVFSFYGSLCFAEQPAEKLKFIFFAIEPYAQNSKNEISGIYPKIALKIAKEFKQPLNVELVPFPRLATSLLSEKNSVTFSFETESLKSKTKQLDVLMEVDSVVARFDVEKAETKNSEKILTIGRMRGGCLDLKAELFLPFKFEELDNFESGFKMLTSKRIDGVCATRDVVNHYIKALKIDSKKIGPTHVISKRKVYIYVNPEMSEPMQADLKKRIAELKKRGL